MGIDSLDPLDFEFTLEADIQRVFDRIDGAAEAATFERED